MGIRNKDKDDAHRRSAATGRRILRNDVARPDLSSLDGSPDPEFDAACEAFVASTSRTSDKHRLSIVPPTPAAATTPEQGRPSETEPESESDRAKGNHVKADALESELAKVRERAAKHEAEAILLRQTITERDKHITDLESHVADTASGRSSDVEALRQARREIAALESARRQLQVVREAEAQRLSEAANREGATQNEINNLRNTVAELQQSRQADAARLGDDARREIAARDEIDDLRRRNADLEQVLQTEASRLSEATQREFAKQREIESLERQLAEAIAENNANVMEFRAILSRQQDKQSEQEMEAQALSQAILQRDIELEELRADMARGESEAFELGEDLRLALLESEAKRAADAEEFLLLLAQREGRA